jgi:hypothetical protein
MTPRSSLALAGCGDRIIVVNLEREPAIKSKLVSELTKALSAQGINVTSSAWEANDSVILHINTELDRAVFDEHVEAAFQPFMQLSSSPPSIIVSVTESDQSKLEYFEIDQGQRFSLYPDWKKADYGNYITYLQGSSLSDVAEVTLQCLCSVKVPMLGKVPAFVFTKVPAKSDALTVMAAISPAMLNMLSMTDLSKNGVGLKVEMDGVDSDKTPWKNAMFIGRQPPEKSLKKEEDGVYYIESDGSQFCYLIYEENQVSSLNMASSTTYSSSSSMSNGCLYTYEECGELISERSGGDSFDIAAFGALGNLKSYKVYY